MMPMSRLKHIAIELKRHAPFTALGAAVGIVVMAAVSLSPIDPKELHEMAHHSFHLFHPAHMLLSSIVTAAIFRRHGGVGSSMIIGFGGAVGICTVSDILLPHVGGVLLGAPMELHLCLIEHPWMVIVPALVGAALGASVVRWTRCPHAGHILVSTSASLFYLIGFGEVVNWLPLLPFVFVVLFVSVWVPCCTSDIVFPHLFVRRVK